jgi:hypothetical protein
MMSPSITGLAIGTLVRRLPMLPHVPDLALELPGLIPFFMTSQYIPAVQKSIVWFLFLGAAFIYRKNMEQHIG